MTSRQSSNKFISKEVDDYSDLKIPDGNIFINYKRKIQSFRFEIEKIIESAEIEFVEIGNKLQKFYSESKSITQISTSLADSMSGEIIGNSITGMREILSRVQHFLSIIKERFESSKSKLETINNILLEISDRTTLFKGIVKHLRILGISTKIESTRPGLEDQGFVALADNVDSLAVKIAEKSSNIKKKLSFLTTLTKKVNVIISGLSEIEYESSNKILGNSQKSLDALISQFSMGSSEAKKILLNSEQISKNIG